MIFFNVKMHVKLSFKAENRSLFKYQPEYPEYNYDQDYDTGNIGFTLVQLLYQFSTRKDNYIAQ